jgi:hypothetical protein
MTYTNKNNAAGITVKLEVTLYHDNHGDLDATGEALTVTDGGNTVFERLGGKVKINEPGDWVDKINSPDSGMAVDNRSPEQSERALESEVEAFAMSGVRTEGRDDKWAKRTTFTNSWMGLTVTHES